MELTEGQVLRDEFTCPITCELIHDPVMCADGHTYERSSITRWLALHDTSPKTGKPLSHKLVVENFNLKRLIDDLIEEGGAGLYTKPSSPALQQETPPPSQRARRFLEREKVLVLECIESSSPGQAGITYIVGQGGAEGGRTRKSDAMSNSFVQLLDDPSVSRRHFRISFAAEQFHICDLGSGSGVLVRIPHAAGHAMTPSSTICVGKHQLRCMSIAHAEELNRTTMCLRCVAPQGSPLEGEDFEISQEGATLGRKEDSTISFVTRIEGKTMGIDSAISMTHARIVSFRVPEDTSHRFVLLDGSEQKPSSNGTWLRLSPVHEPSPPWPLECGLELIIGSSRFKVAIGSTVVEVYR